MIKKIFLAAAIALTMGFAAQAQKFAVVSAEEILAVMPEFAEVQTKLAESSKQYEAEYQKLQAEIEKKYAEFQELDKDASTPQGIKERRLEEINELSQKAQQFVQTAQQHMQRQQMQLLQPVQEKLVNAIKTVGANGNYVMVFPSEVPIYLDSTLVVDITPDVKTQLGISPTAVPAAPATSVAPSTSAVPAATR